jgi:hypothetical protein
MKAEPQLEQSVQEQQIREALKCALARVGHTSSFCSNRFPGFINTTFRIALYQMVLHPPFELAAFTWT